MSLKTETPAQEFSKFLHWRSKFQISVQIFAFVIERIAISL